jgi:hypothetical protein
MDEACLTSWHNLKDRDLFRRPRHKPEGNTKTNLKDIRCEGVR